MKRLLSFVLLAMACPAFGVLGDLDRSGTVDFADFFLFADNFGKTGTPEPVGRDTVRVIHVDTVTVVRLDTSVTFLSTPYREAPNVGPQPDLSGNIPNMLNLGTFAAFWSENWDADIEADGLSVLLWFRGIDFSIDSYNRWPDNRPSVTYRMNAKVFVANYDREGVKKYTEPIFDGIFVFSSAEDNRDLRIPFERIGPIPGVDVYPDNKWLHSMLVNLIVEMTVTFADGSQYAARKNTTCKVKMIDGQYRLWYEGDPAN